jgi:hypothetical protein
VLYPLTGSEATHRVFGVGGVDADRVGEVAQPDSALVEEVVFYYVTMAPAVC